MDRSGKTDDEIDRLNQQAELYETQGLYEQAVRAYQDILAKQPHNHNAQSRIALIERARRAESTSGPVSLQPDELSPRLALDLGLAYMGMNLYSEAIEEFARSLKSSPTMRPDLLRYTIACLVHMEKLDRAKSAMDQLLADPSLTFAEKGGIIADTASLYMEKDLPELAEDLLDRLSDQQKTFVYDYDRLLSEISARLDEQELEVEVEDTETGIVYTKPLQSDPAPHTRPRPTSKGTVPSIPLNTAVTYSLDSRSWHDGRSENISAQWAVLQLNEPVRTGDSLVLKFRLPTLDHDVSVISKVTEPLPKDSEGGGHTVRVELISFLPGGEIALKTFIDEALRDPEILRRSAQRDASVAAGGKRGAGKEEPTADSDATALPELLRAPIRPPAPAPDALSVAGALTLMAKLDAEGIPRVHFACECGQIHVVPAKNTGRKGKCASCGNVLTVPSVDTRPDSLSDRVIGKMVGGCTLLFKLGGGGMGGVFKGHHVALDIPVAVKILHAHLAQKDPVFIKRFIREARAAAKLQHPNIVGVMNVGFENGLHYLIMPFVGGGSGASLLAKKGRLGLDRVLDIAVDMARALIVAEEHNLLHRDIKPANILFDEKGSAKLADLGLAKSYLEGQDVSITQTGIACGTPLYFSPEQAKGSRDLDIRSDIYSLGITLYHLINGSPPFKGESAYVIFQKHVHEPLPPFDDDVPPVPDGVMQLLKQMTAKNPDDRFSGARELLDTLEAFQAEILSAPRPSSQTAARRGLLERLGLKKSD
jgi:tetratricopeptide (TPR) repeat protein